MHRRRRRAIVPDYPSHIKRSLRLCQCQLECRHGASAPAATICRRPFSSSRGDTQYVILRLGCGTVLACGVKADECSTRMNSREANEAALAPS